MKPVTLLRNLTLITTTLFAMNASAYDDDKKKEMCRQPKIQEFTLPIYSETNKKEAQPESEFTFVVSGWANSKKFKLAAKGKDIPFTVQSSETFHKVHAKLLPEFTGETIRISARIPALLECYSTIGWLVKVAGAARPAETAAPAAAETAGVPAAGTSKDGTTPATKPAPKVATPDPAATEAPSDKPAATP